MRASTAHVLTLNAAGGLNCMHKHAAFELAQLEILQAFLCGC